jgi:hypothetical protein
MLVHSEAVTFSAFKHFQSYVNGIHYSVVLLWFHAETVQLSCSLIFGFNLWCLCGIIRICYNIISIVKRTRCASVLNLFILEWHPTCFWRSFCPSSGVQDCTYSNRRMSNRCCWLLGSGYPPASRQQYLFNKYLLLYVQYWTPDGGRKDHPKHVECHSKINKFDTLVQLVGFTIEIILRCMTLWTSNL